jgi:hypothetical protein
VAGIGVDPAQDRWAQKRAAAPRPKSAVAPVVVASLVWWTGLALPLCCTPLPSGPPSRSRIRSPFAAPMPVPVPVPVRSSAAAVAVAVASVVAAVAAAAVAAAAAAVR